MSGIHHWQAAASFNNARLFQGTYGNDGRAAVPESHNIPVHGPTTIAAVMPVDEELWLGAN
jgi:hypothetical protein